MRKKDCYFENGMLYCIVRPEDYGEEISITDAGGSNTKIEKVSIKIGKSRATLVC